MVIYLEDLFVLNLIVNLIIIWISLKLNKEFIKFYKIFLSAFIGAAAVVASVFLNDFWLFILKFTISFPIILILKKYKSYKEFFKLYISFLIVTFILGGSIMLIYQIFNLSYKLNIMALLGGILIVLILIFRFAYSVKYTYKDIYKMELIYKGKSHNLKGFYDTGNELHYKNFSVIVLDKKIFNKIFSKDEIKSAISNNNFIECEFADGSKKIKTVIKIDKILLYSDKKVNTIFNVVAICGSDFKNYDVILNNSFKTEG